MSASVTKCIQSPNDPSRLLFFFLRAECQLIANVSPEVIGAVNILPYRQQHVMVFGYVNDAAHSVSGGIVAIGSACSFVI